MTTRNTHRLRICIDFTSEDQAKDACAHIRDAINEVVKAQGYPAQFNTYDDCIDSIKDDESWMEDDNV